MNTRTSKASLMLLEMIFVVFFFALVSAVCVQVFAAANRMEQRSRNLTEATLAAQNMAEVYAEANGDMTAASLILTDCELTNEGLFVYYDGEWELLQAEEKENAYYIAALEGEDSSSPNLSHATVTVYSQEGAAVYELPVTYYAREALR